MLLPAVLLLSDLALGCASGALKPFLLHASIRLLTSDLPAGLVAAAHICCVHFWALPDLPPWYNGCLFWLPTLLASLRSGHYLLRRTVMWQVLVLLRWNVFSFVYEKPLDLYFGQGFGLC